MTRLHYFLLHTHIPVQQSERGSGTPTDVAPSESGHVARIVFYVACSLALPFYITMATTILVHRYICT